MQNAHKIQAALQILLDAHHYASELACDDWQFAVEIQSLYALGLTNNDLRWLLHRAYTDHARELTVDGGMAREFGPAGGRRLSDSSCFILTVAGIRLARTVYDRELMGLSEVLEKTTEAEAPFAGLPIWDKDRRSLRFGTHLIKQFKVPAPNQEIILATFEEEGWPVRIDDPLPMHASIDPKRRLHDTINSLNRNQLTRRIRFMGNGCGEAIRWEPLPAAKSDSEVEADYSA